MASKKKDIVDEALATLASVREVDDRVVDFVKGKKAKFQFFLKSGQTTAILMMAIPGVVGLLLGYLIGSAG
jgi:hypothetical protein